MSFDPNIVGRDASAALQRLNPVEPKAKSKFIEECKNKLNFIVRLMKTGKFTTSSQACVLLDRKVVGCTKELKNLNEKLKLHSLSKNDEKVIDDMNTTIDTVQNAIKLIIDSSRKTKPSKSLQALFDDISKMQKTLHETEKFKDNVEWTKGITAEPEWKTNLLLEAKTARVTRSVSRRLAETGSHHASSAAAPAKQTHATSHSPHAAEEPRDPKPAGPAGRRLPTQHRAKKETPDDKLKPEGERAPQSSTPSAKRTHVADEYSDKGQNKTSIENPMETVKSTEIYHPRDTGSSATSKPTSVWGQGNAAQRLAKNPSVAEPTANAKAEAERAALMKARQQQNAERETPNYKLREAARQLEEGTAQLEAEAAKTPASKPSAAPRVSPEGQGLSKKAQQRRAKWEKFEKESAGKSTPTAASAATSSVTEPQPKVNTPSSPHISRVENKANKTIQPRRNNTLTARIAGAEMKEQKAAAAPRQAASAAQPTAAINKPIARSSPEQIAVVQDAMRTALGKMKLDPDLRRDMLTSINSLNNSNTEEVANEINIILGQNQSDEFKRATSQEVKNRASNAPEAKATLWDNISHILNAMGSG